MSDFNGIRAWFDEAQAMLERIVSEGWLKARAVVSLMPAASEGDDVVVFDDEERTGERARFHFLRQQKAKGDDQPQLCLADFIAPKDLGIPDYLGAFACTAGLGIDEHVARFDPCRDGALVLLAERCGAGDERGKFGLVQHRAGGVGVVDQALLAGYLAERRGALARPRAASGKVSAWSSYPPFPKKIPGTL